MGNLYFIPEHFDSAADNAKFAFRKGPSEVIVTGVKEHEGNVLSPMLAFHTIGLAFGS